jgi:hypothetical protein
MAEEMWYLLGTAKNTFDLAHIERVFLAEIASNMKRTERACDDNPADLNRRFVEEFERLASECGLQFDSTDNLVISKNA